MAVQRETMTISWVWKHLGDMTLSETGVFRTPLAKYKQPGIYKFILHGSIDQVYIGESSDVRARFRGHRQGGRVAEVVRQHLSEGGRVSVWGAVKIKFGGVTAYGLDMKTNRLAIEGAAVLRANLHQEGKILNVD